MTDPQLPAPVSVDHEALAQAMKAAGGRTGAVATAMSIGGVPGLLLLALVAWGPIKDTVRADVSKVAAEAGTAAAEAVVAKLEPRLVSLETATTGLQADISGLGPVVSASSVKDQEQDKRLGELEAYLAERRRVREEEAASYGDHLREWLVLMDRMESWLDTNQEQ